MAQTNITFNNTSLANFNQSLQIGDTLYYTNMINQDTGLDAILGAIFSPEWSFQTGSNIVEIGIVSNIFHTTTQTVVICQSDNYIVKPLDNYYIFFSKENQVNISDLKGYYGEVKFVNDSNRPAELYAISCDVTESSK